MMVKLIFFLIILKSLKMSSVFLARAPNCGITDPHVLMQIASFLKLQQFPSLVLMLVVCGILPEYWMIYLQHFFVDHYFLTRIRLFKLRARVFGKFLFMSDLNSFPLSRNHQYEVEFQRKFCRSYLRYILPPASDFNSFCELLMLYNQTSLALSQTINIPSALIVSRFPDLFTSLCQLRSFRVEVKILRDRFSWLHWSPYSNSKMFFSIINLMTEAWNPTHRWMYNGRNLFCILLLLMDPSFFPEFRLEEIESAMRSILSGGDPSLFRTYLNVPFIFFLQQSEFYEELKRNAPAAFAALETMTLSDVLGGCGTFHDLSRFMNLSPNRMRLHTFQHTFRWNIPNTFEILGNCFESREFCHHHALLEYGYIKMTIMIYNSFLNFYERFCLPLHLLFHQEPDFRMSLDIAYVPYKCIRDIVFMIFPAFLMKMDIGQTFTFVSNEGDRIQEPHLLLAYFQVMYLNPNSGDLTEAKKMEMISERSRKNSSQDPRNTLREYTKMFEWAASNQLMPCFFSMFLVDMFRKNVPKFLKELGMDLNTPPAYLSPDHSMQKLLEQINIISERLGMPQLTNFDSFVEQAGYNRILPAGIEQYFLREITDQIDPSSFEGPQLMDNLRLEMISSEMILSRPTLDKIISLLRESLHLK